MPIVLRLGSARLDRKGVRLFRHAKVPNLKKPRHISLVSHSTLNDVLLCSVHTSDSNQSTDWATKGLWFTSRQQAESLPFEVSPAPIKGYSGRSVKLNTHLSTSHVMDQGSWPYVNSSNTAGITSHFST